MFYADLHVHSKFSRATSRDCDLEHLAFWAARKGIAVVATGDFTHPGWLDEIRQKLVPAEPGLFQLRPELLSSMEVGALAHSEGLPWMSPAEVRFMLQVEISTIYKKDGAARKVHHLLYAPDLECAGRLRESLERIGNLASDGRPILGLDSRDLLEIVLESGQGTYLVPAHIWTPWFAVLGSKSGFDSIEQCYGDLSPEVFALETGLSSDPAMNWRVSALDRYALVSNSDAHSPPKLGREACVFDTALDYFAIRQALVTGEGYHGTVEFFPEEGKYHLDGHRKCGVCLAPEQTRRHGGNCPECGKELTLGVMHRVIELADRAAPPQPLPPRAARFRSLIRLEEILAEIQGTGPQSNAVRKRYGELLLRLGPELFILEHAPIDQIARAGLPTLAEAVARMRQGRVICQAGYDGEYGVIRLFTPDELRRQSLVGLLFEPSDEPQSASRDAAATVEETRGAASNAQAGSRGSALPGVVAGPPSPPTLSRSGGILDELDPDQRAAAEVTDGPVLIVAGPGTGKTRTLTHRLAHLVIDCGAPPEQCLALTFSRRAAAEMVERLERLIPAQAGRVPVMTFHGLGLSIMREHGDRLGLPAALRVASQAERCELLTESLGVDRQAAAVLLARISRYRRAEGGVARPADPRDADVQLVYRRELRLRGWVDFDDLITRPLQLLDNHPDLAEHYRQRYRWVSVDEYQDIDAAQYDLVRRLAPAGGNLCAIGDPDQAIYGFRGADVRYFQRFAEDFPGARKITLGRNYRSSQAIVDAALQMMAPSSLVIDRRLEALPGGVNQIEIHACSTDRAEAEFVVHTIERLLGGSTFFSLDSRRVAEGEGESFSFADFAVLYRTEAQADLLVEALERSGMPYEHHSHQALADQPWVQSVIRSMAAAQADGASGVTVSELLDRVVAQLPEADRPADGPLTALARLAAQHAGDPGRFCSELALGAEVDLWDARADRISLMTLHAAKGLEFPVVFIVGCEDGLLPLRFGAVDEQGLADERRLLFVGMTRAQQRLILTHAARRLWRGVVRTLGRSPFLDDIERELLAIHEHRARKTRSGPDPQRLLFE